MLDDEELPEFSLSDQDSYSSNKRELSSDTALEIEETQKHTVCYVNMKHISLSFMFMSGIFLKLNFGWAYARRRNREMCGMLPKFQLQRWLPAAANH